MKLALVILAICAISCTSRRMPADSTAVADNAAAAAGKRIYQLHCDKCHPGGEAGLGPALNNNPAPGFIKRFQVRHGLGVMPAFKKDAISPDDLDKIMAYLKARKREPKLPR